MQTSTTVKFENAKFECQRCGNCCRRREDIPLTLDDIFRISDFLNLDPDEFFNEYCVETAADSEMLHYLSYIENIMDAVFWKTASVR